MRFVRCVPGRVGFDPDESTDSLCPTAYQSDIVPHRVRPEVVRKRASRRRGCRFVGEHGLGRIQSLPQYILEVFASSRMCVVVSCETSLLPIGEMAPVGYPSESLREMAVALANMTAV